MSPLGKRFAAIIESRPDFENWDKLSHAINKKTEDVERFLSRPDPKGLWWYATFLHMTSAELAKLFAPPMTEEEKAVFLSQRP